MEVSDMVRMANQIAAFFQSYPHEEAVKEVADHINRFWEPRMRVAFLDYIAAGGKGLDQLVKDSASLVREPKIRPTAKTGTAHAHSGGQLEDGLETADA
ncbi:formate dehydrogenase subunit delta [Aestuariivirga sp.]|uniref:formate dehydrogenase subunit delta n=1 Tax=Aestuariivirga sp. TaxID=2650926 RepID=UPI0039E6DC61